MLPCGHCFHAECIGAWLQREARCPLCRQVSLQTRTTHCAALGEVRVGALTTEPCRQAAHGLDRVLEIVF
jgi:hypothetical protein